MKIHRAILLGAARLVPGKQRTEWLAEWNAELWYVRQSGERQAISFCLGAFRDALWLRRNSPPNARLLLSLKSPAVCLGFLGLLAALCTLFALRFHPSDFPLVPIGQPLFWMLCTALMALPALLATTSLRLGEYPANRCAWRRVFFAIKIALVLPIVSFGAFGVMDLWPYGSGICTLVLYVIAFRWALIDQRRRCPECLRRLECSARIGQPCQPFLDRHVTEFVCARGHGLLQVPEAPTSWFPTQRWEHRSPCSSPLP